MHGTTSKEFTKWLIYIIKLSILLIIHKECEYKMYLQNISNTTKFSLNISTVPYSMWWSCKWQQ
jgi:hypothetical protein